MDIQCRDLSVAVKKERAIRILDGVSFSLASGEALAIMGATGAGKSTLLDTLRGHVPDALTVVGGDAEVCEISVRRPGRRARELDVRIGFLPQNVDESLDARLSVSESIAQPIASRMKKLDARALHVRVLSLLDEMRLPLGVADKYPYELSAGMRQRVALARALVLDPQLLFLDDPLAKLDVEMRIVAYDAIMRRRDDSDLTTVIVTNDEDFAREIGAGSIRLERGHLVA